MSTYVCTKVRTPYVFRQIIVLLHIKLNKFELLLTYYFLKEEKESKNQFFIFFRIYSYRWYRYRTGIVSTVSYPHIDWNLFGWVKYAVTSMYGPYRTERVRYLMYCLDLVCIIRPIYIIIIVYVIIMVNLHKLIILCLCCHYTVPHQSWWVEKIIFYCNYGRGRAMWISDDRSKNNLFLWVQYRTVSCKISN